MILDELAVPIVQAPMAGGPSTPELAAAVCSAGALGFLAAGYKTTAAVTADIAALRERTGAPFGLNIFAPPSDRGDEAELHRYEEALRETARRAGVELGTPRHDDDCFAEKVQLAIDSELAVVSFVFGLPPDDAIASLHAAGAEVWVTVTSPTDAVLAAEAGADALVAQGFEAGGHRSYFADGPDAEDYGLVALLLRLRAAVELPLVASGGIGDGGAVAAVLCAGASAAQLGSALLLAAETATSAPHRAALAAGAGPTRLTRAFTGRSARGIVNDFMDEHDAEAPCAYPDVHHLTAPLRAAARAAGDASAINLWAGQAYPLARELPAAEIIEAIVAEARTALRRAADRLDR